VKVNNATYTEIYRDLQDRKLLKIKTENEIRRLSASECRVIDTHVKTIAQVLDVDPKALNDKTGSSYKSLKILLSLFRRMKRLSEFQKKGMINL
jgi:hypothetical protein